MCIAPPPLLPQIEVLISFIISTVLNGALLAQYIYYNFVVAKPASVKPSASFFKAQPKAEAKAEEEPASSGSSSARRRTKRD